MSSPPLVCASHSSSCARLVDALRVRHGLREEAPVRVRSSRGDALAHVRPRRLQHGHPVEPHRRRAAARLRDVAKVPQQAEARHVRRRVHAYLEHRSARGAVEGGHELDGLGDGPERVDVLLRGGRHDAEAERLGQHERVARARARVRHDARRVHDARHGQAVDRLVRLDGVPAHDVDPGLLRLVGPAAQDVAEDARLQRRVGEADDVQRASTGRPPIAYTSLSAFAAATRPKSYGSSTMGVKKSVVSTSAISSVSR